MWSVKTCPSHLSSRPRARDEGEGVSGIKDDPTAPQVAQEVETKVSKVKE